MAKYILGNALHLDCVMQISFLLKHLYVIIAYAFHDEVHTINNVLAVKMMSVTTHNADAHIQIKFQLLFM